MNDERAPAEIEELLDARAPATTPFLLLSVALLLGAALVLGPSWYEETIFEWLPRNQEDKTAEFTRRLGAAMRLEEEGSYSRAWTSLRELHDSNPSHAGVTLALARLHQRWAVSLRPGEELEKHVRLEFASEYVDHALRARPRWPAGQALRSRICLDLASDRIRRASTWIRPTSTKGKPDLSRSLSELGLADSWLSRARESLPPDGTAGVDPSELRSLKEALAAQSSRSSYKRGLTLEIRGRKADRSEAREIFRELVEAETTPETIRSQASKKLAKLKNRGVPRIGGISGG